MERQAAESDLASSQMNNGDNAHFKHRRTSNDDGYFSISAKNRKNRAQTVSSTTSTVTELEDPAWREGNRIKYPTSELDGRSSTSSDDGRRTNSRSTFVGDGPVQRKHNQNNDEPEHHRNRYRNLSGKRYDVTQRRVSAVQNAITRDSAFYRCCGPDAANTSADMFLCLPAAENSEVPSQIVHPSEKRNTPTNTHATATTSSSISERPAEQDRLQKARVDQMKRYCLAQLALPSKSIPEVAKRRRGNQQRILAAETPHSLLNVHTSKSGEHSISASAAVRVDKYSLASALEDRYYNDAASNTSRATSVSHEHSTPREYTSRHKYSTMTRGSLPRPISSDDTSETSSTITNRQQHSVSDVHSSKFESQTLDRRRGRMSSSNSDRKRKVLEWPSADADTARRDCSSVSSRTTALSRGGRLSVTITDNEPEPEIQRMMGVGQTTVPSPELEDLRNSVRACSNQFYAILANNDLINQMHFLGTEALPNEDSDDEEKCGKSSSSEGTVYGACKEDSDETTGRKEYLRIPTKRTSTPKSSKQRCVDAAVQVVAEELELKRRNLFSCPLTSERDSATKVDRVQILLANLDRTDTGNSPETESSPSREYFRRSEKHIWRAPLAIHGSRPKISVDNQGETTRSNRERSTPTKLSRRRHRHSVALDDSGHHTHLGSNRLSHNRHEKAAVVPAEASLQTSNTNRHNEAVKCNAKERYGTTTLKDKGQQEVLSGATHDRSSDLVGAQEHQRNLKVQPSAVKKRPPLALVDSSVVQGFKSKEPDILVNCITSPQVENKSEKQGEHELSAANRSREIRPDEGRVRETSAVSRNVSNEPVIECPS